MSACEQKIGSEGRALNAEHVPVVRPLVERVARGLARKLPPHLTVNDLEGIGWLAATEAFRRTRIEMTEEELLAFLSCRVRGAMLDYLRTLDSGNKELRNATRRAVRAEGRGADAATVAASREAVRALRESGRSRETPLDEEKLVVSPPSSIEDGILGRTLLNALENLPERLQELLELRYREGWNQNEIAVHFGVSAARVSQLHAEALTILRAAIGETSEVTLREAA